MGKIAEFALLSDMPKDIKLIHASWHSVVIIGLNLIKLL